MQKVLSVTIMTAVLASNFNVEAQIKTALDGPVIEHFDGPSVPRTFFAFGGGVATYDESTSVTRKSRHAKSRA